MAQNAATKHVLLRSTQENGEENGVVKRVKKELNRESCLDQPMDSGSVHEVIKWEPSPLPARHYDSDTTEPISCALQTLDELLSWKLSESNPFNVAVVPLAPREPPLASCPRRTLVSHDMMGGYLEDRFIQGTSSDTPYAFYHWQYIDIFNYFSHNLVTIPPAVWTNAAHRHGVSVIGTFITEWTDGAATCESFLTEEEAYRDVADKLVQISYSYGFDGWLINIENTLSEVAVQNTPRFLRYLTEQMHERVPGSLVLWYDSVIESGKLEWQNELNQVNRMFFDACDGFFTNYNWNEQSLESMRDYAEIQGRHPDVYVGVDVFARGKVVGGMLETNKALEVIRRHNFSVAIFAPGWVYETLSDKAEFRKNQDKFWGLLSDYLFIHQPAVHLPFISSFCQGFGKAVYCKGQVESKRSWFNLTAQEMQPLYYHEELDGPGRLESRGCSEEAWNGGSALLLEGVIPASHPSPVFARIFSSNVSLPSKTLGILIYKASPGIEVSLELKTNSHEHCDNTDTQGNTSTRVSPELLDDGHQLVNQFSQLRENPNGWTVSFWQLEQSHSCALEEISLRIQQKEELQGNRFRCRVGEITFLDVSSLQDPPGEVRGMCIYDVVWLRGAGNSPEVTTSAVHLNATLRWDYPVHLVRHFRVYMRRLRGPDPRIPPGTLVLVGRSYSNLFRVTELPVPEPPGMIELVVEPVIKKSLPVPESHWGRRSISYIEELSH